MSSWLWVPQFPHLRNGDDHSISLCCEDTNGVRMHKVLCAGLTNAPAASPFPAWPLYLTSGS